LPKAGNCFTAGTPVATPTGLQPIETIGSGDAVWSFDFRAGQWIACRVAVCQSGKYDGQFFTLLFENGERLEVTADHPIWVIEGDALAGRPQKGGDEYDDSGLALPGRWVFSQFLRVGDQLVGYNATTRIHEIRSREDSQPVYNLSVLGLPYYAVSPIGILVHNTRTPGSTPNIEENAAAGRAREVAEAERLQAENPNASVQRERYLRDAEGNRIIDPVTGEARRIDIAVIEDGVVTDLVEVTSQDAPKAAQFAKEGRIREQGDVFIRDVDTGELLPVNDVKTRLVRRD
jgi:hypothetical protein